MIISITLIWKENDNKQIINRVHSTLRRIRGKRRPNELRRKFPSKDVSKDLLEIYEYP